MPLLPQAADRDRYRKLFKSDFDWTPAIDFIKRKHGHSGDVSRGALGSHIVYRVGDVWIKLMAPVFAAEMPFELAGLRTVEGRLSVETPRVLATGELEGWPYVILSHVPGEPLRTAWSSFDFQTRRQVSTSMASVMKEIALCPTEEVVANRFSWNEFVRGQYEDVEEQQRKKSLPEEWIAGVRSFLHGFDLSEFETSDPVFLHADLTYDHFLVGTSSPVLSGVIDMADCQTGHREYELAAPAVFVFKGDKAHLRSFLASWGVAREQLNERFSEKILAWSILHRYFSMISFFQTEMNACAPGDFRALARKVFPISSETN